MALSIHRNQTQTFFEACRIYFCLWDKNDIDYDRELWGSHQMKLLSWNMDIY